MEEISTPISASGSFQVSSNLTIFDYSPGQRVGAPSQNLLVHMEEEEEEEEEENIYFEPEEEEEEEVQYLGTTRDEEVEYLGVFWSLLRTQIEDEEVEYVGTTQIHIIPLE